MSDERFFSQDEEGHRSLAMVAFPPAVSKIDGSFFASLREPVPDKIYGAAVDIGTTTLAAYLVDIGARRIAASLSVSNPQCEFGLDAASRLSYINENPEELGRLQRRILGTVNEMLINLAIAASVSVNDIYYVLVGGNSIMEHIFLGVNPGRADKAPFLPVFREAATRRASTLGISIHPGGIIDIAPNISGHIGGDTVAGLIHTGMTNSDNVSLYIDLGTNTEVLLGCKDFLYTCTTSAMPALEGGNISSGMRNIKGALSEYDFKNGKMSFRVIGGGEAKGMCGSGIIDVVAALQRENALTKGGALSTKHLPTSHPFYRRITTSQGGNGSFEVLSSEENANAGRIALTEKDIGEIRLAKGAVGLAADMLMEVTGLAQDDIQRVFVSAPYASNINIRNVRELGLVPSIAEEKVSFFGHSAGYGLCKMLLDKKLFALASNILKLPHNIDISNYNNIKYVFEKHLSFKSNLND